MTLDQTLITISKILTFFVDNMLSLIIISAGLYCVYWFYQTSKVKKPKAKPKEESKKSETQVDEGEIKYETPLEINHIQIDKLKQLFSSPFFWMGFCCGAFVGVLFVVVIL